MPGNENYLKVKTLYYSVKRGYEGYALYYYSTNHQEICIMRYDEDGVVYIIKTNIYHLNSNYYEVYSLETNGEKKSCYHKCYFTNGRDTKSEQYCYSALEQYVEYIYNTNMQIDRENCYLASGRFYYANKYEYDNQNRLKKKISNFKYPIGYYLFFYDENNNLITSSNFSMEGELQSYSINIYKKIE